MRFPFFLALSTGSLLLFSGCATPSASGPMEEEHAHMDMAQMCAMHRQLTDGKSSAEQQAAIEEHIKAMHGTASPEMVAMHKKMMESRCGAAAATPGAK
jgi:hypothetical protein